MKTELEMIADDLLRLSTQMVFARDSTEIARISAQIAFKASVLREINKSLKGAKK